MTVGDDKDEPPKVRPPLKAVENVIDPGHIFRASESGFSGANEDEDSLRGRLNLLLQEHSDLDAAIVALASAPAHDSLTLARLKKKKLQLKDMIQKLRDRLTPDIIA